MKAVTTCLRRAVATQRLLVTGAGPDRLGIVREMSSIVWEDNGHVLDTYISRLAGELTVMMLVELPLERLMEVQFKLSQQLKGLNITSKQVEGLCMRGNFRLSVTGADNVESLHKVAAYLIASGVELTEVNTELDSAPMGGMQLFSLHGVANVSETVDQNEVSAGVKRLAEELGLDIDLK